MIIICFFKVDVSPKYTQPKGSELKYLNRLHDLGIILIENSVWSSVDKELRRSETGRGDE